VSDLDLDLVETSDDSKDTKVRLLFCHTCEIIQPIPDFHGPAEYDEQLHARVAEHQYPGSRPTRGHNLDLGRVSEKSWQDPEKRRSILSKLKDEIGVGNAEGLGIENYAHRDNFMEDAMRCWRFKHNRTADCGDYMSDKMTLLANSVEERRDLGLDPKQRPQLRLCQFCPVHSIVTQKKNQKKGLDR
jgi:hypothetical protein